MAFSREVRLPFLSHELVEFLFTLPPSYKIGGGWTKRILRHAMEPILPKQITWRVDKLGFEPPQAQWLAEPAAQDAIQVSRNDLVTRGVLNRGATSDDWQCLMAHKLFDLTEREWSATEPVGDSPGGEASRALRSKVLS